MPPERDGGVGEPVACLASTYTFHASHFENELVPRFLGLRYDNTEREAVFVLEREDRLSTVTAAVFVDSTQVDGEQTTGRWLQVPVGVPGGCQHGKVTLLAWERFVRIIVASANLTRSGYRKNREMAAVIEFFDGEDSAHRTRLADVLHFFDDLVAFSRTPPETSRRLSEAIETTRRTARSWKLMPLTSERLPSVRFAPVLPPLERRPGRSAIDALGEEWGDRRATDITVMTPFIGESPEAVRSTVKALLKIPRTRNARGHVVVAGRPSARDDDRALVDLPNWFHDEWVSGWGGSEPLVYAVPAHRDGERTAQRALHAKSLLVESGERALLFMGSSNFSPHGLGLGGAFNIEANLCFVARNGDDARALADSLPVDWDADRVEDAIWADDAPKPTEDGPTDAPSPPPVFAWATYHDTLRRLTIGLNHDAAFPSAWWIRVAGLDAVLVQGPPQPDRDQIEVTLSSEAGTRRVTALTIAWRDDEGPIRQATLPTLVADHDELMAPEEFRALGSDGIVDCLLSGRDPIDWAEAQMRGPASQSGDALDPLKTVNTSTYTLYRTRRLGRALAVLSRRLLSTLRTPTAIRHRLERDPVGPLMLASALLREAKTEDAADTAATVFGLAELSLCVAHVAARLDPRGTLKIQPHFRHCIDAIDALRGQLSGAAEGDALGTYVRDVEAKSRELVPLIEEPA